MVSHIYDSMELFLSFMAFITLALGGIGVMNIMLVSSPNEHERLGLSKRSALPQAGSCLNSFSNRSL
jgi:hypothetical protein